jgi:hypothetical protein
MPGYTVEQVLTMPWHVERLILEGMEEEGLVEFSEQTDDLGALQDLGVTVKRVG